MKILTIVGARPQFIKASTISREINKLDDIEEIIVHTGQHFDHNMSEIFFKQLSIPFPKYNLAINNLSHGAMTGLMLNKIEELIKIEKPQWILVYGDTNSTLAGALAASKLNLPIAHVEAGLRSYNLKMPEEINRILTDRISKLLLCPTKSAVKNLQLEGFPHRSKFSKQIIKNVGDVMFDAMLFYKDVAYKKINLEDFDLKHKKYVICTIHREENLENVIRLKNIINAICKIAKEIKVVIPIHPRTKAKLAKLDLLDKLKGTQLLNPLPYLEMQRILASAIFLITDSGGLQKEALFHHIPCITLREETEWIETLEIGVNKLVGTDEKKIINEFQRLKIQSKTKFLQVYGDGNAAKKIVKYFEEIK